jgi:hypothetical protein
MAYKADGSEGLNRDIRSLNFMIGILALYLFIALFIIMMMATGISVQFLLGTAMVVAGFVTLAVALRARSNVFIAMGSALEFAGGGTAAMWNIDIHNQVAILLIMAFGPIALVQYEIGACKLTVGGYVETEGTDFAPAIKSVRDYISRHLRTVFIMAILAYFFSVMMFTLIFHFESLIATDSLVVTGILLIAAIVGATLLLFLKGGKIAKEGELEEAEAALS